MCVICDIEVKYYRQQLTSMCKNQVIIDLEATQYDKFVNFFQKIKPFEMHKSGLSREQGGLKASQMEAKISRIIKGVEELEDFERQEWIETIFLSIKNMAIFRSKLIFHFFEYRLKDQQQRILRQKLQILARVCQIYKIQINEQQFFKILLDFYLKKYGLEVRPFLDLACLYDPNHPIFRKRVKKSTKEQQESRWKMQL